uniref:Uncharacterized protein n=1 Tax=Anopheles coluzzii TaxID=1518534 RepID=A0A8W7PJH2_ANOCL
MFGDTRLRTEIVIILQGCDSPKNFRSASQQPARGDQLLGFAHFQYTERILQLREPGVNVHQIVTAERLDQCFHVRGVERLCLPDHTLQLGYLRLLVLVFLVQLGQQTVFARGKRGISLIGLLLLLLMCWRWCSESYIRHAWFSVLRAQVLFSNLLRR